MQYNTTTNPNPVFGQMGQSVAALQQSLNDKYTGMAGYTPLVVDSKYGPKTQAAFNFKPVAPAMVSTRDVRNQFNNGVNNLNQFSTADDPYAELFNTAFANAGTANAATESNAIASATAATANQQRQLQTEGNQYIAGVETAGERSGASRYLPEYQAGIVAEAKQKLNQQFTLLDQAEKLAIAKAKEARMNADVKVLNEQLEYAKELRKEKARVLERAQDMEWDKYKFEYEKEMDAKRLALSWASENRQAAKDKKSEEEGKNFITFTPAEKKKISAQLGYNAEEIEGIEDYVNQYGTQAFIQNQTQLSKKELRKLKNLLGV